jgi:glutamate-1-semialdehyde 2,1-aminomutase
MTAMREFLSRLDSAEVRALYEGMDERWNGRAALLNARLAAEDLPVRVAHLGTVWTVLYDRPSRYNWMLQFYLRAEGLLLSWVGTGRLIFSLNYTDDDFSAVCDRFVKAAKSMQDDGWWSGPESTDRDIRRVVFREMLRHALGRH